MIIPLKEHRKTSRITQNKQASKQKSIEKKQVQQTQDYERAKSWIPSLKYGKRGFGNVEDER